MKKNKVIRYMDDILFTLGIMSLSLGGFLIYNPLGFFILGSGLITVAIILAKATPKRGDVNDTR